MIPAIRISYRIAEGGNEYGDYVELSANEPRERYHEALDLLLESAEQIYEYLRKDVVHYE